MQHWDRIEAFVEVVRQGSFAGAARRLGVCSSHVSRLVARLETQLETQLLYRTTRQLNLTDAGAVYFDHCGQLFDGFGKASATTVANAPTVAPAVVSAKPRIAMPRFPVRALVTAAAGNALEQGRRHHLSRPFSTSRRPRYGVPGWRAPAPHGAHCPQSRQQQPTRRRQRNRHRCVTVQEIGIGCQELCRYGPHVEPIGPHGSRHPVELAAADEADIAKHVSMAVAHGINAVPQQLAPVHREGAGTGLGRHLAGRARGRAERNMEQRRRAEHDIP